jgi:hypothetical protein
MKRGTERLAILLAASGFSDQMLSEALRDLESLGPNNVLQRVRAIRRNLSANALELLWEESAFSKPRVPTQWDDLVQQIVRLLQTEAHLPATEAAQRLRDSLRAEKDSASVDLPRFHAKEGLRRWLGRVALSVPPSELLHQATKIRNANVHESSLDWPLREREK